MANQVKITFAGDEKDLTRAFKATEAGAESMANAIDHAADKAKAASVKLDQVAEASDNIENVGDKATGSLGGLASGMELLGPSGAGAAKGLMTAALATDFLSGAGAAATLVNDNFRKTLNAVKEASSGLGTALKANAKSIAIMGTGVLAAGALVATFVMRQNAAADSVRAVADALDFQAGKFALVNRQAIQKKLADDGLIESAAKYGISANDLTEAVLGNADAMAKVKSATDTSVQGLGRATSEQGKLADEIKAFSDDVATAEGRQTELNAANAASVDPLERQREATDAARKALVDYAQTVQDQFDPMANLVHRLADVRAAQAEYTKAVKEHGAKSGEAREANLRMAEAILAASGAAASASGTFDGVLTPALRATLRAGGATEAQIRDIESAFRAARRAGDAYSKTYKATAILEEFRKYREGERNPQGRATGGPTEAGKVYQVGENGRELWMETSPGYMFNAAQTAAIMSGGSGGGGNWSGGGGGGQTSSKMILEIRSAGRTDDVLISVIEKAIRQGRLVLTPAGTR
jgi:hypothetical protein